MKEKNQLKRICRYHRISYNERLEALISLYTDCIYIKVDSVYDDLRQRKTHHEIYISSYNQYKSATLKLYENGATMKLISKIEQVLTLWMELELYSFSNDNKITIKGGQEYDKQ